MSDKSDKSDKRNAKADDGASTGSVRKNRKHWCGGKLGREHTPVCMTYSEAKPGSTLGTIYSVKEWRILVCTTCGKELAHHFPIRWRCVKGKLVDYVDTKPAWVTK